MLKVVTFYSNDLSLNPAEAYSFSEKFVLEKNKNKLIEAGVGQYLKKVRRGRGLNSQ